MTKDDIAKRPVSFQDLKKRWGYKFVQGARKRARFDRKFPKSIKVVGNGAMIFWLPDIEDYEKLRGKIHVKEGYYTFYETQAEFEGKGKTNKRRKTHSNIQFLIFVKTTQDNQLMVTVEVKAGAGMSIQGDVSLKKSSHLKKHHTLKFSIGILLEKGSKLNPKM